MVEWNEVKNLRNIRKHHVSFQQASKVFADPNRIIYYDRPHSGYDRNGIWEDRWIAIGRANKRILIVSYTVRDSSIRIISARKASKRVRNLYKSKE